MIENGRQLARSRVDPRDVDLLAILEAKDKTLEIIAHDAVKVRRILKHSMTALRMGADPAGVRAALERWNPTVKEIKRLAGRLT